MEFFSDRRNVQDKKKIRLERKIAFPSLYLFLLRPKILSLKPISYDTSFSLSPIAFNCLVARSCKIATLRVPLCFVNSYCTAISKYCQKLCTRVTTPSTRLNVFNDETTLRVSVCFTDARYELISTNLFHKIREPSPCNDAI